MLHVFCHPISISPPLSLSLLRHENYPFLFLLILLLFSLFFFWLSLNSLVVSSNFLVLRFFYYTNPLSKPVKFDSVGYTYTVSNSEASMGIQGGSVSLFVFSTPTCVRFKIVTVLSFLAFTLYKLRRRPLLGHGYTILIALKWFLSAR